MRWAWNFKKQSLHLDLLSRFGSLYDVLLRAEVADIAMLAAERVVESELDASRHVKLVEGIVSKGFGNA